MFDITKSYSSYYTTIQVYNKNLLIISNVNN